MSNQLQTAINVIKSGDTQQGRQLLVELLKAEPKNEAAWLWLSNVVSTDEQRRHCLKQVLSLNPNHPLAQKGLAILQQKSQDRPVSSLTQVVPAEQKSPVVAQPGSPIKFSQPLPAPSPTATTGPEPAGPPPVQPDAPTPPAKPRLRSLTATQPVISAAPASRVAEKKPPAKALKLPGPQPAMPVYEDAPVKESKRIWIHPKSSLHRVVILYEDGIALLSNPDKATLLQLATSQELPAPAELGRNLTWISIHEITTVEATPGASSFYIRYTQNNRPTLKRVPLADDQALSEFMNAWQTQWGVIFERTFKPYSMFAAMIIPLIAFGVVLLLTYFLHGAALEVAAGHNPEIKGRRVLLQYLVLGLINLVGPTGVLVIGILLAALILFWMFASMLNPPSRTILARLAHPAEAVPAVSPSTAASATQPPVGKLQPKYAAKAQEVKIPAETAPKPPQAKAAVLNRPKNQGLTPLLVRSMLGVLILAALGWAGYLYLNRPSSGYPGLIEGGMAIDLSHRGLTDADLRALALHTYPQTNLVILDLSGNPITELPPEIGQMTNLQDLYLKETSLQTLPPEIGQLSNLRTLNLQDSRLTSVPPEVGQLYHLEYLDLQGNKLRALPLEISRLPNLHTLNVQRTLIQRLPPEFEQNPRLKIYYWYDPFNN